MLKIYNIIEKQEYLREVAELTQKEWGSPLNTEEEFEEKINKKITKIITQMGDTFKILLAMLFSVMTMLIIGATIIIKVTLVV